MTNEQKAAFVNAQVALMQGCMQMMIAENKAREIKGESPANGPDQWNEFLEDWDGALGAENLLKFFNS